MSSKGEGNLPTYVLVVTCVLMRRNKEGILETLILKRSEKEAEGPGLWTIPGGKVDKSDWGKPRKAASHPVYEGILNRAVKREICEEVGIKKLEKLVLMTKKDCIFVRKSGVPTLVMRFWGLCSYDVSVRLDGDCTEYKWITHAAITEHYFIGNVADDIKVAMQECAVQSSL